MIERTTKPKPSPLVMTPARNVLLQRKCACGGTPGPTGECEECNKKKRLGLQAKLKVNTPGDIYEQEADRVAEAIVNTKTTSRPSISSLGSGRTVQRQEPAKPKTEEEKYKEAAKKVGEAFLETAPGKEIKKKAEELGDAFIATLPGKIITGAGVAGAIATLAATHKELPIGIPEIPLDKIKPGLRMKITYEGPVDKPTKVIATFSFPLPGGKASEKKPKQTETQKFRAETARMAAEQAKFREGLKSPEEKAAEEKMLYSYVASRMLRPDQLTPRVSPLSFGVAGEQLGFKPLTSSRGAIGPWSPPFKLTGEVPAIESTTKEKPKKKEEESLQRKATNDREISSAPPIVDEILRSPGQPLDAATRQFMEARFGHDFSQVRIHTDERAAGSARAMAARAYTLGEDIVFGRGGYSPGSSEGSRLLAHELTHVIQHRSASTAAASGLSALEAEADAASRSTRHAGATRVFGRAIAGAPLCDVTESQLARPQVSVVSEGNDDIIVINGVRAFRVQHATEGQKVQRASVGPGGYTSLKGKEYSSVKGVSVSWRWSIPLTYNHPARVITLPAATAQLRNLFPSVEFLPVVTEAPKPESKGEAGKRAKLKGALREVGRKDLEHRPSPFDAPELKAARAGGRQPAWAQEWLGEEEKRRAEAHASVMRRQVEAGMSLIDSVSKTHWSSRAQLEKFIDDYIAAASSDPAKLAQAQKDKKLIFEALKEAQTDLVQEDIERAQGEQWTEQNVATIRSLTPTPIPVQIHAAVGETLVIPVIKGVDFVLDFVPYVGPIKMLLEAITGRTISGQIDLYIQTGKGLEDLPQDLDTIDRLMRVIPFAISAASKIVSKAPGWAEALSKLRKSTNLPDEKLRLLVQDMAKLQGREREIARALVELRAQRLASPGPRLPPALVPAAEAEVKVAAEAEAAAGKGKVISLEEARRVRAQKAAQAAEEAEQAEQKLASGDRPRASSGGGKGKRGKTVSGGSEEFDAPRRRVTESSGSGEINVPPERPAVEVEPKVRGGAIEREHLDSLGPAFSRPPSGDFKGIDTWTGGKPAPSKVLPSGQKVRTITKADVFQVKSVGKAARIEPEVREGLRGLDSDIFTSPTDKSLRVINPKSRTLDIIFEEGAVPDLNREVRAIMRAQAEKAGKQGVAIRWFRWSGGTKTQVTF